MTANQTKTDDFRPFVFLTHLVIDDDLSSLDNSLAIFYMLVVVAISTIFVAGFSFFIRLNTTLSEPPRFNYNELLVILLPPAVAGTALGSIPPALPYLPMYVLIGGNTENTTYAGIFNSLSGNFLISPQSDEIVRGGRHGMCLCMLGVVLLTKCMQTLIPKIKSSRYRLMKWRFGSDNPNKDPIWLKSRAYFRSSAVTIIVYSLFVTFFSFSAEYSSSRQTAYFLVILFVGYVVKGRIKSINRIEALLSTPFLIAIEVMSLYVARVMTSDLSGIILNHLILLSKHLVEILYDEEIEVYFRQMFLDNVYDALRKKKWILHLASLNDFTRTTFLKILKDGFRVDIHVAYWLREHLESRIRFEDLWMRFDEINASIKTNGSQSEVAAETFQRVTAIIHKISIMQLAYYIALPMTYFLILFYDQLRLQEYGNVDSESLGKHCFLTAFMLFSLIIEQPFLLYAVECRCGYKIGEYLIRLRDRFINRKANDSFEDGIHESLPSLDRLCFSSQYYSIMSFCVISLLMSIFGCQMIIVNSYSPFVDYAFFPLLLLTMAILIASEYFARLIAVKVKLWEVKRAKHENTAWHTVHAQENTEEFNGKKEIKQVVENMLTFMEMIEASRHAELTTYNAYLIGVECTKERMQEQEKEKEVELPLSAYLEEEKLEEDWELLLKENKESDVLAEILKILILSSVAALLAPFGAALALAFFVHMIVTTQYGRKVGCNLLIIFTSVCAVLCLVLSIVIFFLYIFIGNPPIFFYWIVGVVGVFISSGMIYCIVHESRERYKLVEIQRRPSRASSREDDVASESGDVTDIQNGRFCFVDFTVQDDVGENEIIDMSSKEGANYDHRNIISKARNDKKVFPV